MENIDYAEKNLENRIKEMGTIVQVFRETECLYLEFENGMNIELADSEINNQAVNYLQSEIEKIKNS
jgi:hypothetical protein